MQGGDETKYPLNILYIYNENTSYRIFADFLILEN